MKRDAWWMDRVPGRMKQAFQRIEAHMTASQIMVTGFALAIFAGGILLSMPFCNADGHWLRFIDALFTACSAVCVTGLVTIVPATQFTLTGKVIVTADGKVATGTMPNNGAVSKMLDAGTPSYTIPRDITAARARCPSQWKQKRSRRPKQRRTLYRPQAKFSPRSAWRQFRMRSRTPPVRMRWRRISSTARRPL